MDLPLNWALTSLGDIANYVNGKAFKPTDWENHGKPIIRIQNLNNHTASFNFSLAEHEQKYLVKNGDLLFAWSASLGAYIWHGEDAWLNQHIFKVHPSICINKVFLYYLLTDITASLYAKSHGSGMVHVTKGKFESTEIIIPPLQEQQRIVTKIEELFSELDKGIESLKTAQQQLKIYRQSLLKHAFSGKLTEQWRAENQDKIETAEALLARIQIEREQWYQELLTNWEDNGRQGTKPKAPKVMPPLTDEELAELPELPDGWVWGKYGDFCAIVRNGISEKPIGDNGTPIFRISAVRALFFDMTDIRYIDNKTGKFDSYCLERGDLVFTRYNGSRHYVGVCAEYRSNEKRLFPDKLVQTRLFSKILLSSSYFEKVLNCGETRKFLESRIRTTAGQSGISGDDIKFSPVPICSIHEQIEIVSFLESKLTITDQLEKTITIALQQSEILRQSILKKAFSGQLVDQDPNDEPASILLERIKAEKAALIHPITKKTKSGKKTV